MRPSLSRCILVILVVSACGDATGPKPPTIASLVGDWRVTSNLRKTFTVPPDSNELARPGATIALSVFTDGQYFRHDSLDLLPPPSTSDDSGSIAISGDTVTFSSALGPPYSFTHVRVRGATLTMSDSPMASFADTSSGSVPLLIVWTLRRQ